MSSQSFRNFFQISHAVTLRLNATNICNIHCDHCDHDAHLPFSKDGELLHRRKPLVADVADVERFCELMVGIGEDDLHLLTGGEITALPLKTLCAYIDVLHRHGRKLGMRTNGFNLCGIPPDKLRLLDQINLNSHGVNGEAVEAGRAYLELHFRGRVVSEETLEHRDLRTLIGHGRGTLQQALDCDHLMATLTLLPPVVLPCCNTWALMNALNTGTLMQALIEAGWSVHNPNLAQTLRDWRQTLPQEFLEIYCAGSCYVTYPDPIPLHPIRSHPQDRVLKRIHSVTVP